MDDTRQVEDRLRAEYVGLRPAMQRTLTALMTEVNYVLLPAILKLDRYEQIVVKGRVKDSESAVDSLRRRQESRSFADPADSYSLTTLPDLIGIRVLAFPQRRVKDVRDLLEADPRLNSWKRDHISSPDPSQPPVAFKYQGRLNPTDPFRSELQVVSSLIGSFWEIEHSAIYKPTPELLGVARSDEMKDRNDAVLIALQRFEQQFDRQIESSD
jgi:ppGpp synthetase/RelA/SpoT-type nucleotidyltranferase